MVIEPRGARGAWLPPSGAGAEVRGRESAVVHAVPTVITTTMAIWRRREIQPKCMSYLPFCVGSVDRACHPEAAAEGSVTRSRVGRILRFAQDDNGVSGRTPGSQRMFSESRW